MNEEIWKDIQGYEGLYQVSNLGRIKSLRWHKIMKTPPTDKNNRRNLYPKLSFHKNGKQKGYRVHKLVAQAFLPSPKPGQVINHMDGNTSNNYISNLELITQSENVKHGLMLRSGGTDKMCGICGGRIVRIRGKYPGDDQREVCPTCLAERMDLINEYSSRNYGIAYQDNSSKKSPS